MISGSLGAEHAPDEQPNDIEQQALALAGHVPQEPEPEPPPEPDEMEMGGESDPFRDYIGRKKRYSADMAKAVIDKAKKWSDCVISNGVMRQARENYRLYLNADPDGNGFNERSFSVTGENGETLSVRFNEFRSLLSLILNMATGEKPALQSKAANSESDSLSAAQLFDGVLEYYISQWKRSRSEKSIDKATELCLFTPAGHLLVEWDPQSGDPFVVDENGTTILRGDLYVKARSFWDVFFDTNLEDEDELDWVIVRDFVNKFDYAAKFPDLRAKILDLKTKTELDASYRWGWDNDTAMIPVYKFFHRSTATCPRGRVVHVLNSELVTVDSDNPYTDENNQAIIPLLTMRANDGLGTLFGYCPGNDIAPVQRAYNMIATGILTNEAAFGVGNVAVERGSDIAVNSLAGGLNVIEYAEGKQKPEAFSVTSNQRQSVEVLELVGHQGEKLSGANSVVRGDPDSSLKAASGRALGLIQAMFVQSQSGLQKNRARFIQDFGNLVLLIVKRFCQTPQVTAIAGKDRVIQTATWTSETFSNIARIVAEPTNPLSKTIGGRAQDAEFLVQNGMVTDPLEYFTVRNTGQLEPIMRPEQSLKNLLHAENSDLLKGLQVPVLRTDKHAKHIESHLVLLDSPIVRREGRVVQAVLAHIQEHEQLEAQEMQLQAQREQAGQVQQQQQAQQKPQHAPRPPPGRQPQHEQQFALPDGKQIPLPDTAQVHQ